MVDVDVCVCECEIFCCSLTVCCCVLLSLLLLLLSQHTHTSSLTQLSLSLMRAHTARTDPSTYRRLKDTLTEEFERVRKYFSLLDSNLEELKVRKNFFLF